MPFTRLVIVVDQCIVDGLSHEIELDLGTVRVQAMLQDPLPPVQVERDVFLTCPTTGRQFRATLLLPQPTGEVITEVLQVNVGVPPSQG